MGKELNMTLIYEKKNTIPQRKLKKKYIFSFSPVNKILGKRNSKCPKATCTIQMSKFVLRMRVGVFNLKAFKMKNYVYVALLFKGARAQKIGLKSTYLKMLFR